MCCIVPIKAIVLYQKLKIMIPDTYLIKGLLIAIVVTLGITVAVTAQPKVAAPDFKERTTIEISPSVFDALVQ
jgi:hypothetical protein